MLSVESIGKGLIIFGVALIFLGALFTILGKLPWFGRLPGDIVIRREGLTIYVPFATMLIISLVITVIFNFVVRR